LTKLIKYLLLISILYPNNFNIELLNERGYKWSKSQNEYWVKISDDYQSIFKVKGVTQNQKVQKIKWTTKNKYYWSNGMVTDTYCLVNPTSYTKNGVGYSMIGLLPELKNKSVTIYGEYQNQVDSLKIHIQ